MKMVTIIGAGVVGCAIAHALAATGRYEVLVVEKNTAIAGENQSSRNSGVVHAGIYYEQSREPLKARLCVEGNALLYEFCKKQMIPCKQCGKLVVATNALEREYLEHILVTAQENNVPGIKMITAEEVAAMEPHVVAAGGALYIPSSGIVEVTRLVTELARLAHAAGALLITGSEVTKISSQGNIFAVTISNRDGEEVIDTDIIINAAGLFADDVARLLNDEVAYRITPVRGESAQFYRTARPGVFLNGMNVYPAPYGYYNTTGERAMVPYETFQKMLDAGEVTKTVGIHLTPTFAGNGDIGDTVTIGPAKTVGIGKNNYGDDLKVPAYYYPRISHYFPKLHQEDCQLFQAGIMATRADGADWLIEYDVRYRGMIHLIGIDSPGLTACLAIAKHIVALTDEV